ncbi:Uroporphyrinogen decarboxylase [Bienertia sinuspersici]
MMMARVRNGCMRSKRVALIWILSAFLFFCIFQMMLKNTSLNNLTSSSSSSSSDAPTSNMEKRARLYEKMARDLDQHGPSFLENGETSQSLSLSDLFSVKDGVVTPNPRKAVKMVFSPYFDKAIWFQNSSLYHFSMFHASHHIVPVPATHNEVEAEANAVKSVAGSLCPLKIVLDRVVLTSTGVLLGCWQVTSGTDPAIIRNKLRKALPYAPEKQLDEGKASDKLNLLHELVAHLNNQIKGFQAIVSELWYVEELDVLALAVDGKMKVRRFRLSCSDA